MARTARNLRGIRRGLAGLWLAAMAWVSPLAAEPYLPADDALVLERLPRAVIGERAELRTLRAQLDRRPDDLALAVRLAERYIALARSESDPRFYGRAEGVMRRWLQADDPPVAALVLRATFAQYRHDFDAAATDLLAVIRRDPGHAQAWLTLATLERVQGRYDRAAEACSRLFRLAPVIIALTCQADVASLTGQARTGHDRLQALAAANIDMPPEIRLWVLSVLAESAVRAGEPRAAEDHFRKAIALGRRDGWLLAAYADFLLDQDRPADARRLLDGETRTDMLLLRLAIAERKLGDPGWEEHSARLRERFAANRARGDFAHQREEARFALSLADDPGAALVLALDNWRVQREPADARLVLGAALASGSPAEAKPVLDWLATTGLEDPAIARLVRRLDERA